MFVTQQQIQELRQFNPQLLMVGGCVRDFLLGKPVNDIDIASAMTPTEAIARCKELGLKHFETGIDHGTITIQFPSVGMVEHTTFRKDVATDGRNASVAFATSFSEDVLRRDFTINALGMTLEGEVIDHVGGVADLRKGLIRTVGSPVERFTEDYLRIVRAIRFASRFGFQIEAETKQAMTDLASGILNYVAKERILQEIEKAMKQEFKPGFFTRLLFFKVPQVGTALFGVEPTFFVPVTYLHEFFVIFVTNPEQWPLTTTQRFLVSFMQQHAEHFNAEFVWKHRSSLMSPDFLSIVQKEKAPLFESARFVTNTLLGFFAMGKQKGWPTELKGAQIGQWQKQQFVDFFDETQREM